MPPVTSRADQSVKSVRIRSYSGPYSVRMRENADQNNSKYGHFLRSGMCGMWRMSLFHSFNVFVHVFDNFVQAFYKT